MKSCWMILVVFLLIGSTYSATINVPLDHPTIQLAINAALNGDTVLVAPGTYVENIIINQDIKVRSSGGSSVTIIDGNQSGCVVNFQGLVTQQNGLLEGFTIYNGKNLTSSGGGIACNWPASPTIRNNFICDNITDYNGGGIWCATSPKIIKNTIINNRSTSNYGGGICCENPTTTLIAEQPIIEENLVQSNVCFFNGGGIYTESEAIIRYNIIQGNGTSSNGGGGGIYCMFAQLIQPTKPTIEKNVIQSNVTQGYYGGGIYIQGHLCEAKILYNVIKENQAGCANIPGNGGGIAVLACSAVINGNSIRDNYAFGNGGGLYAERITKIDVDITFENNTFSSNTCQVDGGGICFVRPYSNLFLRNNTVVENESQEGHGGGIYYSDTYNDQSVLTIRNSIYWNNSAPGHILDSGHEIYISEGENVDINYSDVREGNTSPYVVVVDSCNLLWGNKMLESQDPLFADAANGDYHLSKLSPCINRGCDSAPALDINEHIRPQMGSIDIGSDEYTYASVADKCALSTNVTAGNKITIPASGGTINLDLNANLNNAGRTYLILGSLSGNNPGTLTASGMYLPLNWDTFTDYVNNNLNNSTFVNFYGNLNASGSASAIFNLTSGMSMGTVISFAYYLNQPIDYVSNPINIYVQ